MLASANVSVILNPFLNAPMTFETWRWTLNSALILYQNNVPFGIAITDPAIVRSLRWHASIAVGTGLPWIEALKSITLNLAKFFGIDSLGVGSITPATPANFVMLNCLDALSLDCHVNLVAVKTETECNPQHY